MSKNFAEMSNSSENYEILSPKNQLQLFGYEYYFDTFSKLYKENKLPQTILLSGSKGSGKATFAYHFINYLLSHKEKNRYLLESFTINPKNRSYIEVCNNTHPNFFLLENSSDEENIKIDNVRKLINFLNKSTFYSDIKIV